MGPEHSSARLERFLQMVDEDMEQFPKVDENFEIQQLYQTNWMVMNITTPANYFHALRRQIKLPVRRPVSGFVKKNGGNNDNAVVLVKFAKNSLNQLPLGRVSNWNFKTYGSSLWYERYLKRDKSLRINSMRMLIKYTRLSSSTVFVR